ncbi:MAG TPA: ABC transporter substrate binding protein [Casimicrobiaceae bacterium]|nr:ABC transporter substrate binding protein [Casimicrobiaceae bacterium]
MARIDRSPTVHRDHSRRSSRVDTGVPSARPKDVSYRHAGTDSRIFKGASPGDLPMEQPERFELVINATTAAKLGLTIPRQMRLRADALIR